MTNATPAAKKPPTAHEKIMGKFAPPRNPASAGSTSSIFDVAFRKKYLIIKIPKKMINPFNHYLSDFFWTNLLIK